MGPQDQTGTQKSAADKQPGNFDCRLAGDPGRQDGSKGRIEIEKHHGQVVGEVAVDAVVEVEQGDTAVVIDVLGNDNDADLDTLTRAASCDAAPASWEARARALMPVSVCPWLSAVVP